MLNILEKKIADPNRSIFKRLFKSKQAKFMDDLVKLRYEECINDVIEHVKKHNPPSNMDILQVAVNGKIISECFKHVTFLSDDVIEKTYAMMFNGFSTICFLVDDIPKEKVSDDDLIKSVHYLNEITLLFLENIEIQHQTNFEDLSKIGYLFEHIKENIGVNELIFPNVKHAFLQTRII